MARSTVRSASPSGGALVPLRPVQGGPPISDGRKAMPAWPNSRSKKFTKQLPSEGALLPTILPPTYGVTGSSESGNTILMRDENIGAPYLRLRAVMLISGALPPRSRAPRRAPILPSHPTSSRSFRADDRPVSQAAEPMMSTCDSGDMPLLASHATGSKYSGSGMDADGQKCARNTFYRLSISSPTVVHGHVLVGKS